jgi:hypothetical protein
MTFLLYSLPRDPMAFLSSGFCEEERVRFTGNERTEATFFVPPADLKGLIISMVHVDLLVLAFGFLEGNRDAVGQSRDTGTTGNTPTCSSNLDSNTASLRISTLFMRCISCRM